MKIFKSASQLFFWWSPPWHKHTNLSKYSGHLLFLVSSSSMGGSIMSDKSREPGLGMVLAAKWPPPTVPSIAVVQHEPVYIAVVYISLTFYSAWWSTVPLLRVSFLACAAQASPEHSLYAGAETVLVSHALALGRWGRGGGRRNGVLWEWHLRSYSVHLGTEKETCADFWVLWFTIILSHLENDSGLYRRKGDLWLPADGGGGDDGYIEETINHDDNS